MELKQRKRERALASIRAAYSESTDQKKLKHLSWSFNPSVAVGVACNPNTPASALLRIARWHLHPSVIERIPHHPNATPEILSYVVKKHSAMHPAALLAIVKRSDCPGEIIADVCERKLKGGYLAAEWLAGQQGLNERHLSSLYENWEEPRVILQLAKNSSAPLAVLREILSTTQDRKVFEALSSNSSLPESERVLAALRGLER